MHLTSITKFTYPNLEKENPSDPPVTFELSPTEDGAAQLINKSEGGPITLIRTDY